MKKAFAELGNMNTFDIHVIIRSVNERTEGLCTRLVEDQVPSNCLTIVRERPFSFTLRRSFEIGIEANRRWTLCIDADVLIRKNAISDLINFGENVRDESLGFSGYIFDKLRGGVHSGGLHLYRTKYLSMLMPILMDAPIKARPESYLKTAMREKGYDWIVTRQVFGLHDFEQYYRDIFRKMVVRAIKSSEIILPLIKQASSLAESDNDFLVALWGLRIGQSINETPVIDAGQWRKEIDLLLTAHGINEKSPYLIDGNEQTFVDSLMMDAAASKGVIDSKAYKLPSQRQVDLLKSLHVRKIAWYMGWVINRFGVKIQKHMSN